MSRRKGKFRWSNDEEEEDLEFETSRAQHKRDQVEWEEVICELIELEPSSWGSLPFDEFQREALVELYELSAKKRTAFKRQLGYTKGLFRGQDITHLREALEDGMQYDPPAAHVDAVRWVKRMLTQGDTAVSAFVDAHEEADRQLLRLLLRNALKEPNSKAPRKLLVALRDVLSA